MSMIHKFSMNGYNIVLDVNGGAVHVVDEVAYNLVDLYKEKTKEEIIESLKENYTVEQINEAYDEIKTLEEEGLLYTEDTYQFHPSFVARKKVVKALCLHVAHDCNLKCKYCFAAQGDFGGEKQMMSFEVGKAAIDYLIANSGNRRNLEIDFFGGEPLMNFDVVKQLVEYGRSIEKENNKNIRLTIDKSITEKIRNVLKSDEFNNLDNVGVVLLESKSGKIRAMVQKDESEANINLGIGQLGFEPGSIFKILTEAIALNEGLINVTDTFYCDGSICNNNGKPYAHGALTVSKAFELSCNDIYAKIGNLIGYENMLKYTTNLGLFNKVLGVSGENREEASGVMPKATDGISNFAIGQCVTVTPLQIAGAINAVVNDGVYIKPSIIEDIVDDNNNIIESEQNKENRIFTSTTSKLVKMDMKNVVLNGTGTEAKVDGIIEGGKTGTATGEGGATTHGWFAGYFELNNNEYTLVVVTPNIQGRNENGVELAGGNTAAPIFREIIKSLIN